MRVLLVDRALGNQYTLGLAEGLRAGGVDAWVGGPAESDVQGVVPIYPRGAQGQSAKKIVDGMLGVARFRRLLAKRPDLVHFQWPTKLDRFFAHEARRRGIPIAYTVHNFARATDPAPYQAAQDRFIDQADLVFTHGPTQLRALLKAHPSAMAKSHAVDIGNYERVIQRHPRAQARRALDLPLDEPLYVFVGQIRPRKGVDSLLEAFASHRAAGGGGQVLIAGSATVPDHERRLRELAAQCGDAVHWRVSNEPLPQETLDLAISGATQIVLPFQDVSHSASLVLAMTHGRCVVSTTVGEVPRILDTRGVLVDPGDIEGLKEAFRLAEKNPAFCDELGSRARQYALTELAWSAIGAKTANFYRGVKG